jgi:anaerobic selenocysteine-containing dehydrogenase
VLPDDDRLHLMLESGTYSLGRFPATFACPSSGWPRPWRHGSCRPLVVHADAAAARGIDDGARVRVFNDRDEFRCIARVSDDARAGVAVAPTGWWNRDYEGGRSGRRGYRSAPCPRPTRRPS